MRGRKHQYRCAPVVQRPFGLLFSAIVLLFAMSQSGASMAALPNELSHDSPEDSDAAVEITADRWQRFLQASRGRYQALTEKAGALQMLPSDDCVTAQLSLGERRECLRGDVFARNVMEHDGMALEEYAVILHLTVAPVPTSPISTQQRGQFQRLRAEWWPVMRTASQ